MVIFLIFLVVNISWKRERERERELWPERSSMVREQWPWHHQLLLLLFPSSSSRYVFFIYFVPIQSNTNEIHSRWACLSETSCSCYTARADISPKTSPILFFEPGGGKVRNVWSAPKVGSVVVHLHRQIGCASLSFLFSCGFWWWWFTKWRHFRVDIFCEKKEKWKLMPSEFWWFLFLLALSLCVFAGVFFSSSSEQIVWRKKKGKLLFFCSKVSIIYIHRCVCV
jgi:hypothetical protein